VEAAGIEPGDDLDASDEVACGFEKFRECVAANALQIGCCVGRCVATGDAELQRVIAAWGDGSLPIRRAILAMMVILPLQTNQRPC
jgi:hypothetical protein